MTMTVLERDAKPEEWRRLLDGIAQPMPMASR